MKCIVFDVDKSMSTIGSKEEQEAVFGFPAIPVIGGINNIEGYLDRFLEIKTRPITHPLLGDIGEEFYVSLNDKAREIGLACVVVDSISILGMQERHTLMKEDGLVTMELNTWGKYGERMIKFINKLSKANFPVIVTSHVSRNKDENGMPIDVPALKGASAEEIPRFFDVVAYTHVSAKEGNSVYSWVVSANKRHIYAKNRKGLIADSVITQDFGIIFKAYKEAGFDAPKILIIGDSGQGKTQSLKTLKDIEL